MFLLRIALLFGLVAFIILVWCPMVAQASPEATARAKKFITGHEARLRKLEVAANLAWWNANISGKDEDFQEKEKAQNRIDEALADPKVFKELKEIKEAG